MAEDWEELREKADLEQNVTQVADFLASLWHELYVKMKDKGFSDSEALSLLKVKIYGDCRK